MISIRCQKYLHQRVRARTEHFDFEMKLICNRGMRNVRRILTLFIQIFLYIESTSIMIVVQHTHSTYILNLINHYVPLGLE